MISVVFFQQLQKLRQTRINLFGRTAAATLIQVLSAFGTKSFAVLRTQHLRRKFQADVGSSKLLHIQIQIGKNEITIIVIFVFQLLDQSVLKAVGHLSVHVLTASVTLGNEPEACGIIEGNDTGTVGYGSRQVDGRRDRMTIPQLFSGVGHSLIKGDAFALLQKKLPEI
jgi:hypothetical protein